MAYTPTNWETGDIITAVKLNNMESGIADCDTAISALKEDINGWSDDTKVALLNAFAHVAWTDEHGQDYIDALTDALYPEDPPATLESISCVYTQSGTVYNTDSLDSLKSDLVVTAHYSDTTSATISSGYTLSGTLTIGTSTITVTYEGKTTTFNVTVIDILYPIPNESHDYTGTSDTDYTGRSIAVTNHNHVTYIHSNANSTKNAGTYAIFDEVSLNSSTGDSSNLSNHTDVLFTLPANATVVLALSNIQRTLCSGAVANKSTFAVAFKNGSTSIASTGNLSTETSKTVTYTPEADTDINLAFVYAMPHISKLEFDVSLTVNGDKWI